MSGLESAGEGPSEKSIRGNCGKDVRGRGTRFGNMPHPNGAAHQADAVSDYTRTYLCGKLLARTPSPGHGRIAGPSDRYRAHLQSGRTAQANSRK